jgi:hypothetical protein
VPSSVRIPFITKWDPALFKNVRTGGTSLVQFRAEVFNLFNHPNLNTTSREPAMQIPTAATFGRITGKDDARRDIQLSLRVQFQAETRTFPSGRARQVSARLFCFSGTVGGGVA